MVHTIELILDEYGVKHGCSQKKILRASSNKEQNKVEIDVPYGILKCGTPWGTSISTSTFLLFILKNMEGSFISRGFRWLARSKDL